MLLTLLIALTTTQAAPETDVLTPARQGQLRCVSPNRIRKTCSTLTSYTVRPDGSFDAEVTGMAVQAARIQVRYRMAGKLENGAACFTQDANTLAGATFTKPNARLAQTLQNTLRSQLAASMEPLNGRVRCYRDRGEGGALVSRTTLDGAAQPDMDRPVLWVSPQAGWKVE